MRLVFIITLTLLPVSVFAFEFFSLSTAMYAAAGAATTYIFNKASETSTRDLTTQTNDRNPCLDSECCEPPWLLRNTLDQFHGLYGQPLVVKLLLNAIKKRSAFKKPMAVSFHGPVGTGKTFLSTLIAKSLFYRGEKSQYFHRIALGSHFPNPNEVHRYMEALRDEIVSSLRACPYAVFVFDEFDKMPNGIHTVLTSFLDAGSHVANAQTDKATFIFLSNAGSKAIVRKTYELWKMGVDRDSFSLRDFERELKHFVYNEEGELKDSPLIKKELIDGYVPFLPLEKSHVEACIQDEFQRFHNRPATGAEIADIMQDIQFLLDDLYAENGCKKVVSLVARYDVEA